jgi:hypothetical protein
VQVTLECLKVLVDNFIGHNIELISSLMETCGPYLLKTTPAKFNSLLDLIWRLKEKETLPTNLAQCIEEAYQVCRP